MSDTCAWCDAPKTLDVVCPRCGANYAKAEALKKHGTARHVVDATPAYVAPARPSIDTDDVPDYQQLVKDPASEWKNCLLALPVMLLGAWACQAFNFLDAMQRIMFGMPVHEFGHAVTAWLSGYNAIPTFWFTHTSSERGFACALLLFGIYAALLRYGYRTRQRYWYWLVACLFVLQLWLSFGINSSTADMLITFGGDGMGMVLATFMMCTFYMGKETQLYKGSVRWGLLFWGAAAFMDIFMAWWEGQSNISRVGYGTTGGSLTDAYLLINAYAWTWDQAFDRHLYLGYACLLFLAIVYSLGLRQAHGWVQEKAAAELRERARQRSTASK
jgi:hypothetical protein